jgi:uncharacterized protein (UPF0332 family)
MSVNEMDFYEVAKVNFKLETEIGYRMCLGRSYYAMYHCAKNMISCELPKYSKGGNHYSLIEYLADPHNGETYDKKGMRIISYILRQGRELRNKADYDLSCDSITNLVAETQIIQTEKLIDMCEKLNVKVA